MMMKCTRLFICESFMMERHLMKGGSLSSSTFLFASAFPYYALGLYAKKQIVGLDEQNLSDDEKICIITILEMEDRPGSPGGGV